MEKPKKLKLKRKKQAEDSLDRKLEQNTIHHANDNESNAENTTVISDSDNEVSDKEKNPLQKYENTEIYQSKNRSFLDVKDPHLRSLRDIIMKTSRISSHVELSAFPPHKSPELYSNLAADRNESLAEVIHTRMDYSATKIGVELSPFPAMCQLCRKRRTNGHSGNKSSKRNCISNCDNHVGVNKTTINNNLSDMINISDDFLNQSDEVPNLSRIDIVAHRNNKTVVNRINEDNLTDEVPNVSHIELVAHRNNKAVDNRINEERVTDEVPNISHLDLVAHRKSKAADNRINKERDTTETSLPSNVSNRLPVNNTNSHLMRDRNSNYYALQSRNHANKQVESRNLNSGCTDRRTSSKCKSTSNSESCDIKAKVPKLIGICDTVREEPTLPDKNKSKLNVGKLTEDSSTFSLAFDSDSDFDDVEEIHPHHQIYNQSPPQSNQTNKESTYNSKNQSNIMDSKEININHNMMKLKHRENNINHREKNINHTEKKAFDQRNTSLTHKVRMTDKTVLGGDKPIAPPVADVAGPSHNDQNSATKETSLQSCPLCQVEFSSSTSQMDIDGHIAACLSATDDDVMW